MHLLDRYFLNPHWRTIGKLGQEKILGISATAIIVVPLLSRTLVKLNEMESTLRQSYPTLEPLFPLIKFHFQLPFSIKLVVWPALFAMIGKLVYEGACPLYLKAGDTFEAFRHSQANATNALEDAFLKFMQQSDDRKIGQLVSGLQALDRTITEPALRQGVQTKWTASTVVSINSPHHPYPKGPITHIMRLPELAGPIFYVLQDVMDDCRKPGRIICAYAYYFAIVLLGSALLIQLSWVYQGLML